MAIPFFILAGNFLTHGGVARRMINFATAMVGHWYGGLGLAGVLACALFAAVSGSSPATVVAIGSILLPAMVRAGFPKQFGAGVITTSGALGILIPPSIVMVMYSVATNTSVGALFMAGVIPGIGLAMVLGGVAWYRAKKFNYPRQPKASLGERLRGSLIGGVLAVSVFLVGTFTVNVVSGLVPALSLLVAMLTYVLQVVVMALVVLALVRSGFGGQQEFRQWFAGSVIAVTMVWMSVQVWLFTRQRIPTYAPSDHGEPGGEA